MDAVIVLLGGLVPMLVAAAVLGGLLSMSRGSVLATREWRLNVAGLVVYGFGMLVLAFVCFVIWLTPVLIMGEDSLERLLSRLLMALSTTVAVGVWTTGAVKVFRKMFLAS